MNTLFCVMPRRASPRPSFDPTLSRGIIAVILAIAAVIIILSFFKKAGLVGILLDDYLLSALFGSIRYASPVILLIIAWLTLKETRYTYSILHAIGALLFFVSVSSFVHLQLVPEKMWTEALAGHGGGIFGMLAWPLKTYLGMVGSAVILLGLIAVSAILILNTSLASLLSLSQQGVARLGQWWGRVTTRLNNKDSARFSIHGAYTLYGKEDEHDEEAKSRGFFKKRLTADATDTNEEQHNEEEEADEEDEEEKPATHDVWSKRVIIKELPPMTLLSDKRGKPTSGDIKENAEIIKNMLAEFGIDVDMGEVRVGPTVTQYSLKPSKGVKLSRITALSNDLALALAAHPIRIEAPIPGKALVGIEVPNQKAALVTLRELFETQEFRQRPHNMMIGLGKDVSGKVWFADLTRMPHLLIAGATGSGKTVCINTIIMSLIYQNTAAHLRILLIDPKRVELTLYNGIPHLLTPVITNTQKTINALKWTIAEMERRFEVLAQSRTRDIHSYNQKHREHPMPHIVLIIDELADLMATAAGDVEAGIIRIAQMARAVGIHLIVATQRPSVDVITGLMKANIPARVAFSVASIVDSRTILDMPGAEKLLGRGDMLLLTAELTKPVRIQSAFVSEEEAKDVVDYLKGDEEPEYDESIVQKSAAGGTINLFGGPPDDQDPLFNEAKRMILEAGKASASLLQRRMKVGYARAARILDEMEEAGIIGPADGAKPREILVARSVAGVTMDAFDDTLSEDDESAGGKLNVFDNEEDEVIDEMERDER